MSLHDIRLSRRDALAFAALAGASGSLAISGHAFAGLSGPTRSGPQLPCTGGDPLQSRTGIDSPELFTATATDRPWIRPL